MHEVRHLSGAAELRALAHPLRLRLLEELGLDGPLTATELSDRVGESPSNLSWHLRQLARHGYVEEVDAPGRRRPWRLVSLGHSFTDDLDPDATVAATALMGILERHDVDSWHEFQLRRSAEPEEWRDASFRTTSVAWLTAEELAAVNRAVYDILEPTIDRLTDPDARPAGARPVRLVFWGHPLRGSAADLAEGDQDG